MIEVNLTGVDDFKTYLYTVKGRFSIMLQAMIDVAKVIEANTLPLTPFETGRLGESYHWQVMKYNRDFIEVHGIMDAVDPDSGFHYAYYQHEEDLHHSPPRAGQRYYLAEGIRASESMAYEIIEMDYLSMFGGIRNG